MEKHEICTIEFLGKISGNAEKQWIKRNRIYGLKVFGIAVLIISPIIVGLSLPFQSWRILMAYLGVFIGCSVLISIVSFTPKARAAVLPKRIYVEGNEYITSVNDRSEEIGHITYRSIERVKQVLVYDEFYELVFGFGNISHDFICQKNLLTVGSLEAFEQLFEGKLKDMRESK